MIYNGGIYQKLREVKNECTQYNGRLSSEICK